MRSFVSLSLSVIAGLALLSFAPGCSDGGSSGSAPKSCSSDSDCGSGFGCQLQSAPSAPPGLELRDCDPADPFCDPGDPGGPGPMGPGAGGFGAGFDAGGSDQGGSDAGGSGGSGGGSSGKGGTGTPTAGTSSNGTAGTATAGSSSAPKGKCVALSNNTGGSGNTTGGNGSGNTSGKGTSGSNNGGSNNGGSNNGGSNNGGTSSGSSGSGGSQPSCNGDFSLGQVPFTTGSLDTWGKACDGNVPKNCPDGAYINLAGVGCLCMLECSSLKGNPQPGDACVSSDGVCARIASTNGNGNKATWCVPKQLNLCTEGGSGGSSGGGTSGSGGSTSGSGGSTSGSGGSDSGSGGSDSCAPSGASCSFSSDCCSDNCTDDVCD